MCSTVRDRLFCQRWLVFYSPLPACEALMNVLVCLYPDDRHPWNFTLSYTFFLCVHHKLANPITVRSSSQQCSEPWAPSCIRINSLNWTPHSGVLALPSWIIVHHFAKVIIVLPSDFGIACTSVLQHHKYSNILFQYRETCWQLHGSL